MKRRYNAEQKEYINAKSRLHAIVNQMMKIETDYISRNQIKNADGTTPTRMYELEDNKNYIALNIQYDDFMTRTGMLKIHHDATNRLKRAEENLFEFALSVLRVGKSSQKKLNEIAKNNKDIKKDLIEMALIFEGYKAKRKRS